MPPAVDRSCAAVCELWPGETRVASPNRVKFEAAEAPEPWTSDSASRATQPTAIWTSFTDIPLCVICGTNGGRGDA
ncbi:MAG: hypothetical protein AUG02_03295 [Chloroflexi bacterium 13_1_20CM_2_70_9]|nr:MAG: hypothetical protein AUG02_03295 [Chloroflexi bacterium 13_1_20CM_2_70_9]